MSNTAPSPTKTLHTNLVEFAEAGGDMFADGYNGYSNPQTWEFAVTLLSSRDWLERAKPLAAAFDTKGLLALGEEILDTDPTCVFPGPVNLIEVASAVRHVAALESAPGRRGQKIRYIGPTEMVLVRTRFTKFIVGHSCGGNAKLDEREIVNHLFAGILRVWVPARLKDTNIDAYLAEHITDKDLWVDKSPELFFVGFADSGLVAQTGQPVQFGSAVEAVEWANQAGLDKHRWTVYGGNKDADGKIDPSKLQVWIRFDDFYPKGLAEAAAAVSAKAYTDDLDDDDDEGDE